MTCDAGAVLATVPTLVTGPTLAMSRTSAAHAIAEAICHATGHVLYSGASKDKLYTSLLVYSANEYTFRALTKDQPCFFQLQPFNESGLGPRSQVIEAR